MPALKTVATVSAEPFDAAPPAADGTHASVTMAQAAGIALDKAHSLGWSAVPDAIFHDVARRFWFVYFEKPPVQWATAGSYGLYVDDRSGAIAYVRTPAGTSADVFVNWLSALHMGTVFGTPYKLVLCLLGLVVAGLSGTGVIIWWRKLRSRRAMHRRREEMSHTPQPGMVSRSVAAFAWLGLFGGVELAGTLLGAFQDRF
jgi:uncharacterized iron-regulated membrane protein